MNHIQLKFSVLNNGFNYDIETVFTEVMQGNSSISIKLEIGQTIEDIDSFIHILIKKIYDEKNVSYKNAKREISWGCSSHSTIQPISSIIYDLIINE